MVCVPQLNAPIHALVSPGWWGPQLKILELWFRKTIWYKVQVINYQNNSNSALENKRHGHDVGKGPCSHLWLGPCPCFMAISVSLGTAGGMFHWRQQQDYPRAAVCSQVSILALSSTQWAVSVLCTGCHPKKRHQPVLAAQVARPGLAQQAQHWVRAGLVSRARTARCEELPSVPGLCPGSAISALSPCRDQGSSTTEHWLQSCTQGVHGARVTLVFCKLWGCGPAQDAVSIPLLSLVVPGDKHHLNKANKLDWSSSRCLSRCFS